MRHRQDAHHRGLLEESEDLVLVRDVVLLAERLDPRSQVLDQAEYGLQGHLLLQACQPWLRRGPRFADGLLVFFCARSVNLLLCGSNAHRQVRVLLRIGICRGAVHGLGVPPWQFEVGEVLEALLLSEDGVNQHRVALELVLYDVVQHLKKEDESVVGEGRSEDVGGLAAAVDERQQLEAALQRKALDVGGHVAEYCQQHLHQRVVLWSHNAVGDDLVQRERKDIRVAAVELRHREGNLTGVRLVQPHGEGPFRREDQENEGGCV
mmetsp:Transcript_36927/g.83501  ORF Transcript_36927/g.83501 Transcript_36927/m.83501 type:complete len:265 (-) Transcript_36927:977-1771(-)